MPAEGQYRFYDHPPPAEDFCFMSRAIIFANGFLADPGSVRRFISPADLLIAADGGTRHALALGLAPSVILGDLDSLTSELRRSTELSSARILEYPRDKNETDLELAIQYVVNQGCAEIVIVAALGGRFDQTLGNLSLLTSPRLSTFDIRLDDGLEEAFFTRNACQLSGKPGDLVSLLPWGGEVTGICTEGLRWPLHGETLSPYKTRGISNELLGSKARIEIVSGLLLVVHRRQS
jgi:thiamine pyrophosphokinase